MPSVKLNSSRDKIIKNRHPWIFSRAINSVSGNPVNGETIEVLTSKGEFACRGSYSPMSQIRVRVLSFNHEEEINSSFLQNRIFKSINQRDQIIDLKNTNAFRLINAESDGLPGVIVDKYNEYLVCQFLSAGADYLKKSIVEILADELKPKGIYERSDVDIREKENLKPVKGLLSGVEPGDLIEIKENGIKFFVDVKHGHKTGFYLDQSDNRKLLQDFVKDKTVLNCFSYTGGFSVYALKAGAKKVINIESSLPANSLAMKNFHLNNLDEKLCENITEDVFKALRKFRDEEKTFDVIILDPPKFAESVSQVTKASRAYKDINLLAMKVLNPGGILFTFSCSGHITPDLFQKIIAGAAIDSGRDVKIIKHLSQSSDHPVSLNFPEGHYLKGFICCIG